MFNGYPNATPETNEPSLVAAKKSRRRALEAFFVFVPFPMLTTTGPAEPIFFRIPGIPIGASIFEAFNDFWIGITFAGHSSKRKWFKVTLRVVLAAPSHRTIEMNQFVRGLGRGRGKFIVMTAIGVPNFFHVFRGHGFFLLRSMLHLTKLNFLKVSSKFKPAFSMASHSADLPSLTAAHQFIVPYLPDESLHWPAAQPTARHVSHPPWPWNFLEHVAHL